MKILKKSLLIFISAIHLNSFGLSNEAKARTSEPIAITEHSPTQRLDIVDLPPTTDEMDKNNLKRQAIILCACTLITLSLVGFGVGYSCHQNPSAC